MIDIFFITALVLTTNTIPAGWLQWTQSYSDKKVCEQMVEKDNNLIREAIRRHLGTNRLGKDKLLEIKEIRCITHNEAVRRNTILGHK